MAIQGHYEDDMQHQAGCIVLGENALSWGSFPSFQQGLSSHRGSPFCPQRARA